MLSVILAITVLSGCNKNKTDSSSSDSGQTDSSAAPAPEAPKGVQNPLTGLYDMGEDKSVSVLPVGIMICNDSSTHSQPGIDKADLYVETETEMGVSRIMSVYANADRIPEVVGPLRSGRTPYLQLTRALGWVCGHAGGSPKALEMVKQNDVKHINFIRTSITWRDKELLKANSNMYDHCLATSGEKIKSFINEKTDYGTQTGRNMAWGFSAEDAEASGTPAESLQIAISSHPTGNSFFEYDSEKGVYLKNKGTAEKHTPHKSTDGTQISVTNIVVMYAERYVEQVEKYTRINFRFDKGGDAVVISGGKTRSLNYSYSKSELSFKEADGSAAKLLPGKTYVYIVSNNFKDKTVINPVVSAEEK